MSIQEKKSTKGTPYAIIKFSDQKGEFELFLFSEVLIKNREKLKESESFVLTLFKENSLVENGKKRINVRKILSLDELINEPYDRVTIELKENSKINEIKQILSQTGKTSVNLIISIENKKAIYKLQNNRKLDFKQLKALKAKDYVAKITV